MYTIHLFFSTSINGGKYEALIVMLRAVLDMRVFKIRVSTNSQLITNQINDILKEGQGTIGWVPKVRGLTSGKR